MSFFSDLSILIISTRKYDTICWFYTLRKQTGKINSVLFKMGRKRKIPASYKLRPWYQGDVSSDSDSDEISHYMQRPKIPRVEALQLLSDPPSDPESSASSSRSSPTSSNISSHQDSPTRQQNVRDPESSSSSIRSSHLMEELDRQNVANSDLSPQELDPLPMEQDPTTTRPDVGDPDLSLQELDPLPMEQDPTTTRPDVGDPDTLGRSSSNSNSGMNISLITLLGIRIFFSNTCLQICLFFLRRFITFCRDSPKSIIGFTVFIPRSSSA